MGGLIQAIRLLVSPQSEVGQSVRIGGASAGAPPPRRRRSAAIDLFEVVALVAVALFLLVGIVVAALRPAPLLGLFFGRLRPPAHLPGLATRVALWAEVSAARGHVAAAAAPALRLGLLRRSGLDRPVTLGGQTEGWKEERKEAG